MRSSSLDSLLRQGLQVPTRFRSNTIAPFQAPLPSSAQRPPSFPKHSPTTGGPESDDSEVSLHPYNFIVSCPSSISIMKSRSTTLKILGLIGALQLVAVGNGSQDPLYPPLNGSVTTRCSRCDRSASFTCTDSSCAAITLPVPGGGSISAYVKFVKDVGVHMYTCEAVPPPPVGPPESCTRSLTVCGRRTYHYDNGCVGMYVLFMSPESGYQYAC